MTTIEMYQDMFGIDPAELAALRADRARLDWLAASGMSVHSESDTPGSPWFLVGTVGWYEVAHDLRTAIDRAMAAGAATGGDGHAEP